MRLTLTTFVIGLFLMGGTFGCAKQLQATPPQLSPSVLAATQSALTSLATYLSSRVSDAAIVVAIHNAQTALADDASGKTWGATLRDLLTNLYSEIPLATQNDPLVWGILSAVEVALATVGA